MTDRRRRGMTTRRVAALLRPTRAGTIGVLLLALAIPTGATEPPRVWPVAVAASSIEGVAGPQGVRPSTGAPDAIGQLLSPDSSCTAAVVSSGSGRVAMTAAHCVYVPADTELMPNIGVGVEPCWRDGLTFVPARIGDDAPLGVWTVERAWVSRSWQEVADPVEDIAFLVLGDSAQGTAQHVLGSLGVRFDAGNDVDGRPEPTVDVLGYPTVAPFDGTHLQECPSATTTFAYDGLLETPCPMTFGASGGPWVIPEGDGWSAIALSSYLSVEHPGSLGGVPLGRLAHTLWTAADEWGESA